MQIRITTLLSGYICRRCTDLMQIYKLRQLSKSSNFKHPSLFTLLQFITQLLFIVMQSCLMFSWQRSLNFFVFKEQLHLQKTVYERLLLYNRAKKQGQGVHVHTNILYVCLYILYEINNINFDRNERDNNFIKQRCGKVLTPVREAKKKLNSGEIRTRGNFEANWEGSCHTRQLIFTCCPGILPYIGLNANTACNSFHCYIKPFVIHITVFEINIYKISECRIPSRIKEAKKHLIWS